MFQHADLWEMADNATFCEMKDYTLFALSKLIQHCESKAIIPASTTEQHLKKVTHNIIEESKTNLQPGAAADPVIGSES